MRERIVLACMLVFACGDAKAPSGSKAEVDLPTKRDAPTKADDKPDAIAKADPKADAKADAPVDPKPTELTPDANADAPSGGADAIGVAECDAYITKYSKCIETGVPAEIRDLMKEAIEHSREAWKKAAAGNEKAELPSICKGALAAAKQATAKYGCAW